MKKYSIIVLVSLFISSALFAQKGMGDQTGISRNPEGVEMHELSGIVKEVKVGPCKNTTGRSDEGMHWMVEKNGDLFNVHLGPASKMPEIVENVQVGDRVSVLAFTTTKLPANNYIAKSIKSNDKAFELRDEQLHPFWSRRNERRNVGRK